MLTKMSKHHKIANWLLFDAKTADDHQQKSVSSNLGQKKHELLEVKKRMISSVKRNRIQQVIEDNELTRSPVSGTYIIKEWTTTTNTGNSSKKHMASSLSSVKQSGKMSFSKSEVALNSIAASFVEITPESRARLARIPNRIGAFECKLCKYVYNDAFELAMHNCPRVVHIEYRHVLLYFFLFCLNKI